MNNDNFLIEESDLELAKDICKDIEDSKTRNRAMANALASDLAIKYFQEIEADTESGLHKIAYVLNDIDIADVYLRNSYVDVRVYFNENELCVPKSHFDRDLLPIAYMFVKLDSELSGAAVTGFITPSAIDRSVELNGYYKVNESDLVSYYDIEPLLVTREEEDLPKDIDSLVFDYLDGKLSNDDVNAFYRFLLTSSEYRQKLRDAAGVKNIFNFVSVVGKGATLEKQENTSAPIEELEPLTQEDSLLEESGDFDLLEEEPTLDDSSDLDSFGDAESLDSQEELGLAATEEVDLLESVGEEDLSEDFDLAESDDSFGLLEEDSADDITSDDGGLLEASSDELLLGEELDSGSELQEESVDVGISETDDIGSLTLASAVDQAEVEIGFVDSSDFGLLEESSVEPTIQADVPEALPSVSDDEASISTLDSMIDDSDNFGLLEETSEILDSSEDVNGANEYDIVSEPSKDESSIEELSFVDYADSESSSDATVEEMPEDNEFSTSVTPSLETIESEETDELESLLDNDENRSVFDQEEQENGENNEQIEDLFADNGESQEVLEENFVQPVKQKKSSFIPVVGTLAIVAAIAYFGYTKYMENSMESAEIPDSTQTVVQPQEQISKPVKEQEVMPIESVENIVLQKQSNEGNAVSIPAIEQNLDASILVSNLSVNWEVPAGYVSNNASKRYFTKIGKIIQLNLKTEMLLLSKPPITNKIMVELEFNKNTNKFAVKGIIASSGEKNVDDLIVRTVKNTLDMNLKTNMSSFGSISGNPVLVIRL